MRFISFQVEGRSTYGVVDGSGVIDLGARLGGELPDLKAYLEAAANDPAGPAPKVGTADYALDEIVFEPVIPQPGKIVCVGLNYEEHRQETGRAKSEYPALFTRWADTLLGHGQPIRRPTVSKALDYEGELAVVIGRQARHVPHERALEIVVGYACFNDATLRDWQRHTHQFTPGKNFPATGGFGPELVTPDEIEAFDDARIETTLNGTVVQSATLGDMIFPIAEVIAYVSGFTTLAPGDVIATGTPGGVGFKREPQLFMKAGDTVEVAIAGVGRLVNGVIDDPQAA